MGDGGAEPEAESSAVTANSVETMGAEVGQEDQTIPLLPEAVPPVRREVRVLSMKRSLSGAGSGAQKQAARPMRVIGLPQIKRLPHPRKECSPRFLSCHHQELLLCQFQPDFPLPEGDESSLLEECPHAGAEAGGDPLHPFAQAGALQPRLWLPRNL